MFTDFIITFRETLEAALVAGIVLSYLARIGQQSWYRTVYWAIGVGVVVSVLAGVLFEAMLGGFAGANEEIFEGIIMLTAAALITWMIVWMMRMRHQIKARLQQRVDLHVEQGNGVGMFLLVFIAVLREGIETVLFLKASALQSGGNSLLFAVFGILLAIGLGYLIFSGLRKVSLSRFFSVTSAILILFAAGLIAHGVHELEEVGWIPATVEVWDVNPEVITEGVYPVLHEKGALGGLLKGVFGWNGNPSLLELASYFVYLLLVGGWTWKRSTSPGSSA